MTATPVYLFRLIDLYSATEQLDRDYFSIPENDIKRISSILTIVNGEIIHDTGRLRTH